jgi:hypothetical protein
MATSNSYNYTTNRDQIITRALRIIGAVGQGETPSTYAISEGAESLNDMVKAWESDGMQLWAIREYILTPQQGIANYLVGNGYTIDAPAPTKILQAWSRNTDNNLDTPILLITRHEYNMLGNKTQQGSPSQFWYDPPGSINGSENVGSCTIFVTPDDHYVTDSIIMFTGVKSIQDFDSSTDVMDFPQYWGNAVKWGLASELCYEYGVGLSERSQIERRAEKEKQMALSYGTEEGHLLIQPVRGWHWETY